MKITIDPDKCRGSGRCVQACPERAITLVDGKGRVDLSRCDLDGICIPACPNDAISLVDTED